MVRIEGYFDFKNRGALLAVYFKLIFDSEIIPWSYHLNRDQGVTNVPLRHGGNILNRSTFDPVLNVVRADLAYTKAGADFGAQESSGENSSKKISVDSNLVQLIDGVSPEAKLPESSYPIPGEMQRYLRFRTLVNPASVFAP